METFRIITDRPIIEGQYNTEEDYSFASDEENIRLKPKQPNFNPSGLGLASSTITQNNTQSEQTESKKGLKKILGNWRDGKDDRKGNRSERKALRQDNRSTRKSNRKANRNARILKRITGRNGKTFFGYKLSKVTNRTKTNPDGTKSAVSENSIVKDSRGNQYDKKEVAKATGVPESNVTTQMVDGFANNSPVGSPDVYVPIPEEKIVVNESDAPYLITETTGAGEPPKDEKELDKEKEKKLDKGMKKSTKIILIASGLVVASLIVYAIVKSKPTVPTTTK